MQKRPKPDHADSVEPSLGEQQRDRVYIVRLHANGSWPAPQVPRARAKFHDQDTGAWLQHREHVLENR